MVQKSELSMTTWKNRSKALHMGTPVTTSQKTLAHLPKEIIDREMARVLATKTEAERLQIAWGMWRSARRMIIRVVSAERPELSEQEVERETARRMSHGH